MRVQEVLWYFVLQVVQIHETFKSSPETFIEDFQTLLNHAFPLSIVPRASNFTLATAASRA